VITTLLYFVIFGKLIGRQIGEMQGFSYMDYIVPGLILMSIITNAYANVVSSFYQAKYHHHIEEILVSPTPNFVIIAGYVAGGIARGITVGLAVMAVAFLFSEVRFEHPWVARAHAAHLPGGCFLQRFHPATTMAAGLDVQSRAVHDRRLSLCHAG